MFDFDGKRVTVAGLGRFGGGIAVSRWLAGRGARVLVTDKDTPERLADSVRTLDGVPNLTFRLGEHRTADFTDTDVVVTSPAVPPASVYLAAARAAGVPVTTEIRLFIERCLATVIGVTGTKGKSTASSMLAAMLRTKYPRTRVGGNLGGSLLADLPDIAPADLVVLELSSYMLEYLRDTKWSPHVGVVTMVASDHLEWHGSHEAYVDAKRNLFRHTGADDIAVLPEPPDPAASFADHTPARVVRFGSATSRSFALNLIGDHNQHNAQAAFRAAEVFGVTWDAAQDSLRSFQPLRHRLQTVLTDARGVRWVNDSIATVPEAAIAALGAFPPRTVLQIVGGKEVRAPLAPLTAALGDRAKVVLCIGQTGPDIAALLAASSAVPVYTCGDLATAVRTVRGLTAPGDTVLLSTGCKSNDQYVNFEARGDEFARLARGN